MTLRNNPGKRPDEPGDLRPGAERPAIAEPGAGRIRRDLIIDQGPLQMRDSDYFPQAHPTCSRSATATTSISLTRKVLVAGGKCCVP
ncbi:hypothetical protein ACPA9J_18400 [Pseudomonas aeruginosa]